MEKLWADCNSDRQTIEMRIKPATFLLSLVPMALKHQERILNCERKRQILMANRKWWLKFSKLGTSQIWFLVDSHAFSNTMYMYFDHICFVYLLSATLITTSWLSPVPISLSARHRYVPQSLCCTLEIVRDGVLTVDPLYLLELVVEIWVAWPFTILCQ